MNLAEFDLFALRKTLVLAIEPLTLVALMLAIGCLLSWLGRWRAAGRVLMTIAVVVFLLLAYGVPFTRCARTLENQYSPIVDASAFSDVHWIVVLGAGHTSSPAVPANSQAGASALFRIVEAVRLHRAIPRSRILFSGGAIYNMVSEAAFDRDVAVALGVSPEQLTLEPHPRTTAEEFSCIQRVVRSERFILVTTALHMPRAMMLSQSYGLGAIPSPTDYRTHLAEHGPMAIWPHAGAFSLASATFHEIAAISWMRMRLAFGRPLAEPGLCARLPGPV